MPATVAQILTRTYENYARILLLATEKMASHTQADIDAVVTAAGSAGVVRPKVTYGENGRTVDWTAYQQTLLTMMKTIQEQIIAASGPYELKLHASL
jgi:uncharacterized iron-regulated protein